VAKQCPNNWWLFAFQRILSEALAEGLRVEPQQVAVLPLDEDDAVDRARQLTVRFRHRVGGLSDESVRICQHCYPIWAGHTTA